MTRTRLTKIVTTALMAGALGLGGGMAPLATAAPAAPVPLKPGSDCFPFCDGPGGPRGHGGPDFAHGNDHHDDHHDGPRNDHHDGPPNGHRDDHWGDKGPWWANNRHDWWDDRNGPPPWGWGPPPPVQWRGGPLPRAIDYWGYHLNPVWDNGFHQWGIWLFGVWIPILGVG